MSNECLDAYNRGYRDAEQGRYPLFKKVRDRGIIPTIDDGMADNWSEDARASYLDGWSEAFG